MTERLFEGAWQWLPEGADGRLLLTHRNMCAVFGQKDRPAPVGEFSTTLSTT